MFLVFEVILMIISIFLARKMVKKRNFMAKGMLIGKDDEKTVEIMKRIAKEVILTGKFENLNILQKFKITLSIENEIVTEVTVETAMTKVVFDSKEGEKYVYNKAWSERGATVWLGLTVWALINFILMCTSGIVWILNSGYQYF